MASEDTVLIFVRHGETEHNAKMLFQGHLDAPLNARGRAQAAAAAERLRPVDLERCYTSDLQRASETARIIVGHDALRCDPELRERHFGDWQGKGHVEIAAADPAGRARLRAADPDFAPPGGETWGAFSARAWAAVERIAAEEAGRRVLVVTHGGVLRAVVNRILGLPVDAPRRFSITNCAIGRVAHGVHGWRMDSWGEADHLEALGYIRL